MGNVEEISKLDKPSEELLKIYSDLQLNKIKNKKYYIPDPDNVSLEHFPIAYEISTVSEYYDEFIQMINNWKDLANKRPFFHDQCNESSRLIVYIQNNQDNKVCILLPRIKKTDNCEIKKILEDKKMNDMEPKKIKFFIISILEHLIDALKHLHKQKYAHRKLRLDKVIIKLKNITKTKEKKKSDIYLVEDMTLTGIKYLKTYGDV